MNPTPRTLERINYLLDPATLDALLDTFQSLGMPMGSDRWAEYCTTLVRQREDEAMMLRTVTSMLEKITAAQQRGTDWFYIEQRKRLTEDHQKRTAERDGEITS